MLLNTHATFFTVHVNGGVKVRILPPTPPPQKWPAGVIRVCNDSPPPPQIYDYPSCLSMGLPPTVSDTYQLWFFLLLTHTHTHSCHGRNCTLLFLSFISRPLRRQCQEKSMVFCHRNCTDSPTVWGLHFALLHCPKGHRFSAI